MRRWLLVTALLSACASAPQPKESWAEAGYARDVDDEPRAPSLSPEELAVREQLGPLAVSTFRFDAVQRVLREANEGKSMPEDAVRAWSGLFAAIDQALAGAFPAPHSELLRARLAADAELELDRRAYLGLPAGLDAAVHARVQALRAKLGGARLARAKPEDDAPLSWPIRPAVITSLFGPRLDPIDHQTWRRHEGLDIAAEQGDLVTAAARGTVTEADRRSGYGLVVSILHDDGTITRYGHLSQLLTTRGARIERGGAVGLAGATGRATGPHVHFEVWRDGKALDPLEELGDPDLPDVAKMIGKR